VVRLQKIAADWKEPTIVAASGPSLTVEVARLARFARWLRGWRIVAVSDAWRRIPQADALYSCDARWWQSQNGVPAFEGERWSTHEGGPGSCNDKSDLPESWRVNLVRGAHAPGFSRDASVIHYGDNSGFQAINLAILKGATRIVLVGFDMRRVGGLSHFFGDHPAGLSMPTDYGKYVPAFRQAAKACSVPIVNATPGSAIDCWPFMPLEEALREDDSLRGDRPKPDAGSAAGGAQPPLADLRVQ
jgi:hypothetical protein